MTSSGHWRHGRRNPRTIYLQLGQEPSDRDPCIGMLDTPEITKLAVQAVNARLDGQAEKRAVSANVLVDAVVRYWRADRSVLGILGIGAEFAVLLDELEKAWPR